MNDTSGLSTARDMLQRHGLRAQAVAMERITELRHQGDSAALHRWEQTYAALRALRRSAPSRARDN